MNIDVLAQEMPLLLDLRPDFTVDKITEILRSCAIKLAEDTQVFERTYTVQLQCGVKEYLLDECEEVINTIKRVQYISDTGASTSCTCNGNTFTAVNNICSTQNGCNGGIFRFVPLNMIEVSQDEGLSGVLSITATVAPKYDACEIDDLFGSKYRNALFYAAGAMALEYPGDNKDRSLASIYAAKAADAASIMAVRRITGHVNTAKQITSKRFV